MKYYRLIYRAGMLRAHRAVARQYGQEFWRRFAAEAASALDEVIAKTPDIGSTIFAFNYAFTPAYIAWYRAARAQGLTQAQTDSLLWLFNEGIITLVPKFARRAYMDAYLRAFRKKAPAHEALCAAGRVHPYDYRLKYIEGGQNTFGIDITECGMLKLARDFGAEGIFPAVCRVDYLMAHLMGSGFERTKTLGDGDDCCNCRYTIGGTCEWAPEKGFVERK